MRIHSHGLLSVWYRRAKSECLECNYLPSCHASCVQKIIEGNKFVCRKSEIEKNIFKRLENIINKKRLTR